MLVVFGAHLPLTSRAHAATVGTEETGLASWYGYSHRWRRTANGERYQPWELTAAHRTLPLGSRVRVTNLRNGRAVEVRVNDRGPSRPGRIIDLSRAAAARLGALEAGVVRVRVRILALPGRRDEPRVRRQSTRTLGAAGPDAGNGRSRRDAVHDPRTQPAAWPVDGPITAGFGLRRSLGGTRSRFHRGVDIGVPAGTPVRAPAAGTVASARRDGSYGLAVLVDHGRGIRTRYAHLSSIAVRPGQRVERGSILGASGNTGRSAGPHLHYEVLVDGRPVNPRRVGLT